MSKRPIDPRLPIAEEYLLGMGLAWWIFCTDSAVVLLLHPGFPLEFLPALLWGAVGMSIVVLVVGGPVVLCVRVVVRSFTSRRWDVAMFAGAGLITAMVPTTALDLGVGSAARMVICGGGAVAGGAARLILDGVITHRLAQTRPLLHSWLERDQADAGTLDEG